ncbi:MAG: DegT/DnrJ/EryC1/StrS family aminotransferase, partial [Planctomycetota bacterium]
HGMDPERRYHFPIVGFNYRMSNLTAALLCAQLERREALVARRRAIMRLYDEQLRLQPGLTRRTDAPWAGVSPWLFAVVVDGDAFGLGRDGLAAALAARGIETRPLFPPLHQTPPYRRLAARRGIASLQFAEWLGASGLMLPTHPLMTDDDVAFVCEAIAAAGRGHARRRTA